jgi:hypothetical protein
VACALSRFSKANRTIRFGGSPLIERLAAARAFVSGRGVGVCLDVAEAGGALRANGSFAAGRGLTRSEAARRSHAAISILSKERQATSWRRPRLQRLRQQLRSGSCPELLISWLPTADGGAAPQVAIVARMDARSLKVELIKVGEACVCIAMRCADSPRVRVAAQRVSERRYRRPYPDPLSLFQDTFNVADCRGAFRIAAMGGPRPAPSNPEVAPW